MNDLFIYSSIYLFIYLFIYTGCVEGTQASNLDGRNHQRHIWNLLGHRHNTLCITGICLLQDQSRCIFHCQNNAHVQYCCQSVCICSYKPTIQGEDEGNDLLQITLHCTEGSCCERTTGHRDVHEHHNPT